ncbi:hypothetical protein BDN70DRAFT_899678 [Pholiota conissans]|uniref:Uncharacterized protein n=1 Tax=Pholiota conissans TaxID=109636 RepID=A0A9P5YR20_9AGAR|nr:hypothetical protein BDN70DRAFT_899678 [Pholiota conissans]
MDCKAPPGKLHLSQPDVDPQLAQCPLSSYHKLLAKPDAAGMSKTPVELIEEIISKYSSGNVVNACNSLRKGEFIGGQSWSFWNYIIEASFDSESNTGGSDSSYWCNRLDVASVKYLWDPMRTSSNAVCIQTKACCCDNSAVLEPRSFSSKQFNTNQPALGRKPKLTYPEMNAAFEFCVGGGVFVKDRRGNKYIAIYEGADTMIIGGMTVYTAYYVRKGAGRGRVVQVTVGRLQALQ